VIRAKSEKRDLCMLSGCHHTRDSCFTLYLSPLQFLLVGQYRPPLVNVGQYRPSSVSVGQYRPSLVSVGQYRPSLVNVGQYRPSSVSVGQYRPSLVSVGQYRPSLVSVGQYRPSLVSVGQYRPSLVSVGQYRPSLVSVGQYRPSLVMLASTGLLLQALARAEQYKPVYLSQVRSFKLWGRGGGTGEQRGRTGGLEMNMGKWKGLNRPWKR